MPKPSTSFRISDEARYLMDHVASRLSISQTAVIEVALRDLAKREGVARPTPEQLAAWKQRKNE